MDVIAGDLGDFSVPERDAHFLPDRLRPEAEGAFVIGNLEKETGHPERCDFPVEDDLGRGFFFRSGELSKVGLPLVFNPLADRRVKGGGIKGQADVIVGIQALASPVRMRFRMGEGQEKEGNPGEVFFCLELPGQIPPAE